MKKSVFTLLVILVAITSYAGEDSNYSDVTPFHDSTGEWTVNPEVEYIYKIMPFTEEYAIYFSIKEPSKRTLLMSYSPKALNRWYGLNGYDSCDISLDVMFNSCDLIFDVNFYHHQDMKKVEVARIEMMKANHATNERITMQTSVAIHKAYPEFKDYPYCIDTINIYADSYKQLPDIYIKNLSIDHIVYMNQSTPGYTDLYIDVFPYKLIYTPDEIVSLDFGLYFGHESQYCDIYMVFYNQENLFFFPNWTTNVEKVTVFIERETFFPAWQRIASYQLSQFDLHGKNMFTIGIAPTGTLDFLNKIVFRTVNLE